MLLTIRLVVFLSIIRGVVSIDSAHACISNLEPPNGPGTVPPSCVAGRYAQQSDCQVNQVCIPTTTGGVCCRIKNVPQPTVGPIVQPQPMPNTHVWWQWPSYFEVIPAGAPAQIAPLPYTFDDTVSSLTGAYKGYAGSAYPAVVGALPSLAGAVPRVSAAAMHMAAARPAAANGLLASVPVISGAVPGLTGAMAPLAGAAVDPTAIGALSSASASMSAALPAMTGGMTMLAVSRLAEAKEEEKSDSGGGGGAGGAAGGAAGGGGGLAGLAGMLGRKRK